MLSFSAFCALGCLVRYGAEWSIGRVTGAGRLWGTFIVNGVGCLVAGAILGSAAQPAAWILPFCGGLTSYSAAFAGPLQAWHEGSRRTGLFVLWATPVLCVVACTIGAAL